MMMVVVVVSTATGDENIKSQMRANFKTQSLADDSQ